MAISTGATESVRPYLEAVLNEVGSTLQKSPVISIFDTAFEFQVEMLPAESDNRYGGITCHARVKCEIQDIEKAEGNQRLADTLDYVSFLIKQRGEQNRPVIGTKGPPWIPPLTVKLTETKITPNQLTAVWEIDMPTAIGGFR